MIYAEAGTSFVGAALSWLPGFDPILYQAATLPTFAVASVCVGPALFLANRTVRRRRRRSPALLAVAVVPYATGDGDAAGRLRAAARVLALARLAGRTRRALDRRLSAVVALDYFQTKVIGIMALGSCSSERSSSGTVIAPTFRLAAIGAALLALGATVVIGLLSRVRELVLGPGEAEGAAARRRARE